MAAAGFCAAELFFHGESPPPAFVPCLLVREEVAELDRAHLGPDAARRTEIRNAALGRNSLAGKRNHRAGLLDQVAQLADAGLKIGCDHCYTVPDAADRRPKAKRKRTQTRSRCDFCTPCCACAISMQPCISTANCLGSRRFAAG